MLLVNLRGLFSSSKQQQKAQELPACCGIATHQYPSASTQSLQASTLKIPVSRTVRLLHRWVPKSLGTPASSRPQEWLWSCRVEAPLPAAAAPAQPAAASGCMLAAGPQSPGTLGSDIGLQNLSPWRGSFVACAWLTCLPCLLKCRLLRQMNQLGCWVLHYKAGNKTNLFPTTYFAKSCFPLCFLNYP